MIPSDSSPFSRRRGVFNLTAGVRNADDVQRIQDVLTVADAAALRVLTTTGALSPARSDAPVDEFWCAVDDVARQCFDRFARREDLKAWLLAFGQGIDTDAAVDALEPAEASLAEGAYFLGVAIGLRLAGELS